MAANSKFLALSETDGISKTAKLIDDREYSPKFVQIECIDGVGEQGGMGGDSAGPSGCLDKIRDECCCIPEVLVTRLVGLPHRRTDGDDTLVNHMVNDGSRIGLGADAIESGNDSIDRFF